MHHNLTFVVEANRATFFLEITYSFPKIPFRCRDRTSKSNNSVIIVVKCPLQFPLLVLPPSFPNPRQKREDSFSGRDKGGSLMSTRAFSFYLFLSFFFF